MAGVRRAVWSKLSEIAGRAPAARSSHTVTRVGRPEGPLVCVFGGEDSPRNAFDGLPHAVSGRDRTAWSTKSLSASPGLPRLGHGAASLGSKMYIFGGRLGGPNTFSGEDSGESGDFFCYDVSNDSWSTCASTGPMPEPRSFHAMCSAEGGSAAARVYVFGGCGARGRLNDVWCYDAAAESWTCLHEGGSSAPLPRGGSAIFASADGTRLALLFGFSGAQQGDIAIFDVQKKTWDIRMHEDQLGEVPSPRSVFAAAQLPELMRDTVVLFGGEAEASDLGHAGAGQFLNDLHALDLRTLTWTKVQAEGEIPEARGWGGMAALDSKSILMFGGLNSKNERLGDAWKLVVEDTPPSAL